MRLYQGPNAAAPPSACFNVYSVYSLTGKWLGTMFSVEIILIHSQSGWNN